MKYNTPLDLEFSINPASRDGLHLQIRKQIEYYVTVGRLRVGDTLPTIRELEAQLGINRHTIRKAYQDLAARGLLTVRRGARAVVASNDSHIEMCRRDPRIDQLIAKTLKMAEQIGYPPVVFSRMLAPVALEMDRSSPYIAFAECSIEQADDLARALEAHIGQAVAPVNIDAPEFGGAAIPESVRLVVSTAFHMNDLKQALRERDVRLLMVRLTVGQRFRSLASRLLPMERPCMILRDEDSVGLFPELVRTTLGLDTEVRPLLMDKPEDVARAIEKSDAVFFSNPCREFVRATVPASIKTQELFFEFTPDALDSVRRAVGL